MKGELEMAENGNRLLAFVGSYADAAGNGVYVYEVNEKTGGLKLLDQVSGLQNPTFLNLDADRRILYAIAEKASEQGQRMGAAVAFAINPAEGTLSELNRAVTTDTQTCHIQRDSQSRYLVVTSYSGGKVGLIGLQENGLVGELLDVKQHEGKSVHERQDQPHPHSAFFSPDEQFVLIPDLGLDRVRVYRLNRADSRLDFHADAALHPGAGPRHLAFHPNGKFAYVINELDSTISSFRYDAEAGTLSHVQTVSTVPADFEGENWCAEIQVSADGKFVYGSNRGHDSIVVLAANADSGELSVVQHISTEGQHPRHFSLSPDGSLLIAANRDTDNIAVFRVDRETGTLSFTGQTVKASKPVCVRMAYFA